MTDYSLKPRLLLADDHEDVLTWVETLLEDEFCIVGTAHDGEGLIEAAALLRPDLIIADVVMPRMNGISSVRAIRDLLPACRFVFLSMHNEPDLVREALAAGASGFVLKVAADTDLPQAARDALAGRRFVSALIHYPD
ncbi:MAG: response regulator transcription factor [Candidatus Solibacter sp.]|nr:response regulator transcription factor [Candidatus Solibacter sp.]